MSAFDPTMFLDATTTEAQVKRPPLPAGQVFKGIIKEPKSRSWTKKDDPTKTGIAIDIPVEIDLTPYHSQLGPEFAGIEKITLVDGVMLDLKADGMIDFAPGKNGKLRRYREALGLNEPGQSFSIRMMQERQLAVKVSHRTWEGEVFDQIDSPVKA